MREDADTQRCGEVYVGRAAAMHTGRVPRQFWQLRRCGRHDSPLSHRCRGTNHNPARKEATMQRQLNIGLNLVGEHTGPEQREHTTKITRNTHIAVPPRDTTQRQSPRFATTISSMPSNTSTHAVHPACAALECLSFACAWA